jgi:ribosome-associated translation inhibitor RaiA
MEIIINSVNFKADKTLETFVREKVGKVFSHCHKIIRADVVLRNGENEKPGSKLCEIRLMIPGYDHFVKKSTEVYEKSVLQAVNVLLKILRRDKSRLITTRHLH